MVQLSVSLFLNVCIVKENSAIRVFLFIYVDEQKSGGKQEEQKDLGIS